MQSSYIPWKGYFDVMRRVDEFILYDDVQYTRRDWRNRNRIKAADGLVWLTIPVRSKGRYLALIKDMEISEPSWRRRHWKSIDHHYRRAPFFGEYGPKVRELFEGATSHRLSEINHHLLAGLGGLLGIDTPLTWSMGYSLPSGIEDRTERLVQLCRRAGATHYLSGPTAKAYLDEKVFERERIALEFMDYSGYPPYSQLFPPFAHEVSVVDLILNEGPGATRFLLPLR